MSQPLAPVTPAHANQTSYAPGLMVKVRDELWLITSVTQSVDGYLLKVRGLSDYVRDTTASFYTALDDVEVFDPAKVEVVPDHSPGYRTTRLWLETTLRQTPVPLYQEQLSVADQMLMDPLDYQLAQEEPDQGPEDAGRLGGGHARRALGRRADAAQPHRGRAR